MADYGVNLYGNAILVNAKFADENPEAVKAFLRAFTKALKDSLSKSSVAIDSVIKRSGALRKDLELERFKMAVRDNILTPEVKANGYGGVDLARLDKAIDQIALTYDFKNRPKADDIFTSQYLPPAPERKL